MSNPGLSILTASHKNLDGLKTIYKEIHNCLSNLCCWIIKDSGYCSKTKEWITSLKNPYIFFSNLSDNGVYEALNWCVDQSTHDFYIVVGSDDFLFKDSLDLILSEIENDFYLNHDVIVYSIIKSNRVIKPHKFIPLNLSVKSLIASHSLGLLLRRDLHIKFGLYNINYSILADSLFIKIIYMNGARFLKRHDLITGDFGVCGISSTNHKKMIDEAFKYNVETGSCLFIQILYKYIRKLKYLS